MDSCPWCQCVYDSIHFDGRIHDRFWFLLFCVAIFVGTFWLTGGTGKQVCSSKGGLVCQVVVMSVRTGKPRDQVWVLLTFNERNKT